ncbi:hypothetical protein [Streptomyces phaeochromogenes]|uniref:hypothetical protein n=1 Tax=Streptomyces phaeochromogenes TaxID=1923 RepID=UPI00386D468C|nr:DUF3040 domain-containing protein [Streptomyces phaeochromogenes]
MSSSEDDMRVLAEMERRLRRDDPGLVTLLDALNEQFLYDEDADDTPDGNDDSEGEDGSGGHDWRWHVIVVFLVVLTVSLILTLVLNRSPSAPDGPATSNGRGPLLDTAASVQRVQ